MRHSDGNLSTALVATGCDVKNEGKASVTTVHLKDPVYNIRVDLKYRAYNDVDMIEAWTEILNGEKGTVTLTTFASAIDRKSKRLNSSHITRSRMPSSA